MTKKIKQIRQNVEKIISNTQDITPKKDENLTQKIKSFTSFVSLSGMEKLNPKATKELLICLFGLVLAIIAFSNPDKLEEIARVFNLFLE